MSKFAMQFSRILLVIVSSTAGLFSTPATSVYALTPIARAPSTAPLPSNERLELIWAREQALHDRMAVLFDHADDIIARAQDLLDRAKANGKDVTALQSALDAVADAIKTARPVFESSQGTIAAHKGFDGNGNVTDSAAAAVTVKELGEKLRETRSILLEPLRDLRAAIRDFRRANGPASPPNREPNP